MKKQKLKSVIIVLCALAACTAYGYDRLRGGEQGGEILIAQTDGASDTAAKAGDDTRDAAAETGDVDPGSQGGEWKAFGSGEQEAQAGPEADGKTHGFAAQEESPALLQEDTAAAVPLCYVHICGEVASPGVYEMEAGSRIFQAVELAGGFTDGAAADYLNMAREICDGMKIVVPNREQIRETAEGKPEYGVFDPAGASLKETGAGVSGSGQKGSGKVNLNTATKEELMTLRGIGEARALDIITYREEHGGFQTVEEIMKISGIKDAAFQKIKDDITV